MCPIFQRRADNIAPLITVSRPRIRLVAAFLSARVYETPPERYKIIWSGGEGGEETHPWRALPQSPHLMAFDFFATLWRVRTPPGVLTLRTLFDLVA